MTQLTEYNEYKEHVRDWGVRLHRICKRRRTLHRMLTSSRRLSVGRRFAIEKDFSTYDAAFKECQVEAKQLGKQRMALMRVGLI